METITPGPATRHSPQWKTQDYRGKQIHVCTALRTEENEELSGHGQQWKFMVRATAQGGDPASAEAACAESDLDTFYSTQSIAEDLAFARGRELVDAM